jgi:hypothetical protein
VAATASPFRRPQGAIPEAWFALPARLLRAVCPAVGSALLLAAAAAVCPARRLPERAALAPFERAARPELARLLAAAIAWRRRAEAGEAVRPSAAAQPALRWAQPAASVAPVGVLPSEGSVVRYARLAAAVVASQASAAAVARQQEVAAALRARAAAAVVGQDGAVELPQAAAGAARLGGAEEEEAARVWAAAGRRPAAEAVPDVGQRQAVRPSAAPWAFHPDQVLPWPAPSPAGRFARAMRVPRIAWP